MLYHFLCKRGIRPARTEQFLVKLRGLETQSSRLRVNLEDRRHRALGSGQALGIGDTELSAQGKLRAGFLNLGVATPLGVA